MSGIHDIGTLLLSVTMATQRHSMTSSYLHKMWGARRNASRKKVDDGGLGTQQEKVRREISNSDTTLAHAGHLINSHDDGWRRLNGAETLLDMCRRCEGCCQEATEGVYDSVYSNCVRREITDGMAERHRRTQAAVESRSFASVRITTHLNGKYPGLQLLVNALETIPGEGGGLWRATHWEFRSKIPVCGG